MLRPVGIPKGCSVSRPARPESSVDVARARCGRLALTTTTGRLVVRRTVRVSPSSSIASVCSDTWTDTVRPAWTRPSETGWRQTVITPVALTVR
jgi:hypothetical protein